MIVLLYCLWVWDVPAQTSLGNKQGYARACTKAKRTQELILSTASFPTRGGISLVVGRSPDAWA